MAKVILIILLLLQGCVKKNYINHKVFRRLKIGDKVPYILDEDKNKNVYYVVIISDKISADDDCQNEKCGSLGKKIMENNGRLIMSADGKLAHMFGIEVLHAKEYTLDADLMVISDRNQKVIGLFENAKLSNYKEIIKTYNLAQQFENAL